MPDDVARIVGTPDGDEFEIKGKKVRLRPLNMETLQLIEKEALSKYRKSFLEALKASEGLLTAAEIREEVISSAKWGPDDLPKKEVHDAGPVEPTDKVINWFCGKFGLTKSTFKDPIANARIVRRMLSMALDSESITADQFEELTGRHPRVMKTGYINWWITGTNEGMVSMIYHSIQDPDISREDIIDYLGGDKERMVDMTRTIEKMTVPETKNG